MSNRGMLSVREVAQLLMIQPASVTKLIRIGQLRASDVSLTPGGRPTWRVEREEVESFLRRRAHSAVPKRRRKRRTKEVAAASAPNSAGCETTRVRAEASWTDGPSLEVDGGGRVWRNLGVAVTFTRSRRDGESSVSGTVPHPFFFEQPRTLDAAGPSLSRTETAVHVGLAWTHAVTRRLAVVAIAGVIWALSALKVL